MENKQTRVCLLSTFILTKFNLELFLLVASRITVFQQYKMQDNVDFLTSRLCELSTLHSTDSSSAPLLMLLMGCLFFYFTIFWMDYHPLIW